MTKIKNFIKKNWFRTIMLLLFIVIAYSLSFYLIIGPYLAKKEYKKCSEFILNAETSTNQSINEINQAIDLCVKAGWVKNKKTPKKLENCNFEISDLHEYKGKYGDYRYTDSYVVYEGIIKNISNKTQTLKAMLSKIYTEDDVYISEGYTEYNKTIEPNKALPFKITIVVPTSHNTVVRKYFEDSKEIKNDIYPWFLTCN